MFQITQLNAFRTEPPLVHSLRINGSEEVIFQVHFPSARSGHQRLQLPFLRGKSRLLPICVVQTCSTVRIHSCGLETHHFCLACRRILTLGGIQVQLKESFLTRRLRWRLDRSVSENHGSRMFTPKMRFGVCTVVLPKMRFEYRVSGHSQSRCNMM